MYLSYVIWIDTKTGSTVKMKFCDCLCVFFNVRVDSIISRNGMSKVFSVLYSVPVTVLRPWCVSVRIESLELCTLLYLSFME